MEQRTFFETDTSRPLAARLRPNTLEEFVGQRHLIGEGKILRRLIEADRISSMIFWGPPGVGKTTLARIIANSTKARFIDFSAVTSGIKEIKQVMQQAEDNLRFGEKTILFVDEIHRFNKAQQDAFLPFVEKGSIILIGATTENPSFEVNSALLSRCKVFVLKALEPEDIEAVLRRESSIDKRILFVTYVGLTKRDMDWIRAEIEKRAEFDAIYFTQASPVIAVNCGAGTFGLLIRDSAYE